MRYIQVQKEPGTIRKQPRRGAASNKTNSERTRIDQKTTHMRYIQVQKEPGRSANNLEEVRQELEKPRKQPGGIKNNSEEHHDLVKH